MTFLRRTSGAETGARGDLLSRSVRQPVGALLQELLQGSCAPGSFRGERLRAERQITELCQVEGGIQRCLQGRKISKKFLFVLSESK